MVPERRGLDKEESVPDLQLAEQRNVERKYLPETYKHGRGLTRTFFCCDRISGLSPLVDPRSCGVTAHLGRGRQESKTPFFPGLPRAMASPLPLAPRPPPPHPSDARGPPIKEAFVSRPKPTAATPDNLGRGGAGGSLHAKGIARGAGAPETMARGHKKNTLLGYCVPRTFPPACLARVRGKPPRSRSGLGLLRNISRPSFSVDARGGGRLNKMFVIMWPTSTRGRRDTETHSREIFIPGR